MKWRRVSSLDTQEMWHARDQTEYEKWEANYTSHFSAPLGGEEILTKLAALHEQFNLYKRSGTPSATYRWLCGLNIGDVNRVACCVERSGNRHLFVRELLRIVLIVKEVSSYFALRRLACDQGKLSVLELHNLACECVGLLRGLLLLLALLRLCLLGVAATLGLGSQAGGKSAKGRSQNQCERLSMMFAPCQYIHLPPVFRVDCNLGIRP